MALRIYNTLAHRKETFEPLQQGRVGIYLCGPTVYLGSHIGHAVGPVIFDTVKRYLTARGFDVTLVLNITDIDDKIINRANQENVDWQMIAKDVTENYLENMAALGVTNIDIMPYATEHIDDIIRMVQGLIDKGFAYEADGSVYFEIDKARSYGKLSGRQVDELIAGARIEVDERKKSPGDFALWKAAKPDEPSWPSPWGNGRPGWHIECSVMSMKYLGETFDIHGGGVDLVFPHHENEILQSESYTGKPFARCWMHNGLTTINGQKMSKSLGNVVELTELLSQYPAEVVRFLILQTHYRSPMNFSPDGLETAKKALDSFHRFIERVERATGCDAYVATADASFDPPEGLLHEELSNATGAFFTAMDDDFNTARAIASLFDLLAALNRKADQTGLDTATAEGVQRDFVAATAYLRKLAGILGLLEKRPEAVRGDGPGDEEIAQRLAERAQARKDKDFARADAIRDELSAQGIRIEDTPSGAIWRRQ